MNINLSVIEKKVLSALLFLCNDENLVIANNKDIADAMRYSSPGGAITFALQALEFKNYIHRLKRGSAKERYKNTYKVLI